MKKKGRPFSHGKSKERIYSIWTGMMNRVKNKDSDNYKKYFRQNGNKPIEYDPRWEKFENFYLDMGEDNGLTIDRIDNEKGYFKNNCRWADRSMQIHNQRPKGRIKIRGVDFRKSLGKYRASVGYKGKKYHIGLFKTAELAGLAYAACSWVIYGE